MTPPALVDPTLTVRSVRCRARVNGHGAMQVRAALDRLDTDTGLPRSTILVVRKLRGSVSGNPPQVDPIDLRAVASRAHRPTVAPLPADCNAVLFADEAELLVCLCRDVASGSPLGWWWTVVLGRGGAAPGVRSLGRRASVASAFDRYARAIPAAAAVAPRAVKAATGELARHEVLRVMGVMAEVHGAHALAEVIRPAWQHALQAAYSGSASAGAAIQPVAARVAGAGAAEGGSAGEVGEVLVVTARRLHRDPATMRSAAAAQWLKAQLSLEVEQPRRIVSTDAEARRTESVAFTAPPSAELTTSPRPPSTNPDRFTTRSSIPATGASTREEPGRTFLDADIGPPGSPRAVTQVPDDEEPPDCAVFSTSYGGAFYLLNLLEHLDPPESADRVGEPGPSLTRWGVLALVLRLWPEVDRKDALHAELCDLAWPDGAPAQLEATWAAELGTSDADLLAYGAAAVAELQELLAQAGLEPHVVAVPARVELSGFSVRVHMALDDIDLDVRRAGLDHDPGWVPALGRVVEFLFT